MYIHMYTAAVYDDDKLSLQSLVRTQQQLLHMLGGQTRSTQLYNKRFISASFCTIITTSAVCSSAGHNT